MIIKTEKAAKVFNPGMPDEMRALTDVSIEIEKGEVTVLKGPSGSGKTTLLSLIGCMARPTEGKVILHGKDVAKLPERFLTYIRRETFGFIFQQFHLIRGMSVIENVMLPLYPLDISLSRMRDRALNILKRLDLSRKENVKIQNLSGGEQQRVAIGRALIHEPEIILADEPTAHLDSKLSEDFIDILFKINQEGKTLVIATHDPLVYEKPFIKKIIEMRDGMVKELKVRG